MVRYRLIHYDLKNQSLLEIIGYWEVIVGDCLLDE